MQKADPKRIQDVAAGKRYRVGIRCLECGIPTRNVEQAEATFAPATRCCSSRVCENSNRVHVDLKHAHAPEDALLYIESPNVKIKTGPVLIGGQGLIDRAKRVLHYLVDEDLDWPMS